MADRKMDQENLRAGGMLGELGTNDEEPEEADEEPEYVETEVWLEEAQTWVCIDFIDFIYVIDFIFGTLF